MYIVTLKGRIRNEYLRRDLNVVSMEEKMRDCHSSWANMRKTRNRPYMKDHNLVDRGGY